MSLHWFEARYPESWQWAFTGEDPACTKMTQEQLSKALHERTGDILTVPAINHIVRKLNPYESVRAETTESVTESTETDSIEDTPSPPTLEESVEARLTSAQQILQLKAEQRYLRELEQGEARRRLILQALKDGAALLPPPSPYVSPRPLGNANETPHTMLLMMSDLHAGQLVDPTQVGERFGYDKDVLEASIDQWLRTIRRYLDIYRNTFPVTKIVLAALGDMVHGSDMRPINKLQLDPRIGSIGRQTMYVGRLLSLVVRELAAEVDEVGFIGVGGNHGRVGKFGDNEYLDNFDWLAYHFTEQSCNNIKNVKFYIPDTPTAFVKLGNKTFHMQHGELIRSWGETPHGAIKRAVRKDAFVLGTTPDYFLLGHFHQAGGFQIGGGSRVYMNSSFPGGDKYCVEQMKEACEPTQNLLMVHPHRGVVGHHEIALRAEQAEPAKPFDFEVI